MSRGSKRRRTGAGTSAEGPPRYQVWIFAPEGRRASPERQELLEDARRTADKRGLLVKIRRTRRRILTGGPDAHKRLELVEPTDAGQLYAAVHRHPVLVLALAASWVRGDPSEEPARLRQARTLQDFVKYKALYATVRGPGDPDRLLDQFANWPLPQSGMTISNPRILPLHVFDRERVWPNLDTSSGVAEFNAAHGSPGRRLDPSGRSWCPDPSRHGRDSLTVSGFTLPHGFHWDVMCQRAGDRIVTCHEVWKVGGKHVNVYPDAYVRIDQASGRRVWPK